MTYEGLIDQANKAWEDGPRLAIMIDELSLVMAASRGSNLSLDELLLFLDEESECGKTAASIQRKLVDPAISAVLGCQWDCLQEVVAGPGPVAGQSMLHCMLDAIFHSLPLVWLYCALMCKSLCIWLCFLQ